MAFDYKTFASEIGLPDDDKAVLFGLFEKHPSAMSKIEGILGTQVAAQLTPLKAELEAKQRDLDAQFDTLASIRGTDEAAIAAAESRIEKLSSQSAVLTERLRKVATDAGLNAEDVLRDLAETKAPEKKVETPVFDERRIMAEANRSALSAFENAALLEDLNAEHQALFGKPMSRVDLIATLKDTVKRTGNPNLGLREVFDQKFNVAAKRDEMREADVQRRITDAVKARETALADEYALRGTHVPLDQTRRQSPIFQSLKSDDKPAHVGGVPESVVASIDAYRKLRSERKAS